MIAWATSRPAVVWALAAGIVLAGFVAFTKLPLAAKGQVEFPKISVSASWPGSSPELVETYVTSPIEGAIQGVRGVHKTSSMSTEGSASITVELEPKTDVVMARLAILERMETLRSGLPDAARRSLQVGAWTPDDLKSQPLLEINFVGPYTPGTLQQVIEDQVQPTLSALDGVASVQIRGGGAVTGVAISYDPVRLQRLGIDPGALSDAVMKARIVQSLGMSKSGASELTVTLRDQPSVIEDLARLPVVGPGGKVFALGELAVVHPQEDSRGYFYRINGTTAISLSIMRLPGADAIKTAARVRAALDQLRPSLTRGVRFQVTSDESTDLDKQLKDLLLRGAIAFAAVLLVLLVTLRSFGGSMLVIGSATIAIAGTALSLYLLKIPANMLTLAGLAMGIGIIVQNGLVVTERLRSATNTAEGRAVAGKKISSAVFGSTLTTTVVLLPFLYLQGDSRELFTPFAVAFALALFWSVGAALLFVPAVGRGSGGRYRGWPRLGRLYNWLVIHLLRWRYLTIVGTAAILAVLTWGFVKKVPRSAWGNWWGQPRTTVSASVSFPKGSDPGEVDRLITELEQVSVGREGVSIVRAMGTSQGGQLLVEFTPEGGRSEMPWVIYDDLVNRATLIGGAQSVSVQPPEGQGYYGGSGGGGSISHSIRILGYSYEGVRQVAMDLKTRLERIPRVRDVDINASGGWSREHNVSISVEPDRQAIGRTGASMAQFSASVARQLRNPGALATLDIGNQDVDVSVQAAGARERSVDQLADGLVSNPHGTAIRIGDVSTLGEVQSLAAIQREDQQYIRILNYDFRGPSKLAERVHKAFMASIAVPPGYTVEENQGTWGLDNSNKGLWVVSAMGVGLVLIAVAFVFDSIWAPMMILLAIPLALGGVMAAFWVTKTAFTSEAAVGVILVVGLAVNHTILQIDAAVAARKRHGRLTGADVFHAASDRVTMIVLVTLTTLASLAPMAIGAESGSMFAAIALATAGGTIGGTLGVMFLLPPMMLGFRRFHWRRRARRPEAATTAAG